MIKNHRFIIQKPPQKYKNKNIHVFTDGLVNIFGISEIGPQTKECFPVTHACV